jgi:serine/threonine-protein kinase HipA
MKERNLNAKELIDYFGKERMKLNGTIISQELNKISAEWSNWGKLITVSFLSNEMKEKYFEIMKNRRKIVVL